MSYEFIPAAFQHQCFISEKASPNDRYMGQHLNKTALYGEIEWIDYSISTYRHRNWFLPVIITIIKGLCKIEKSTEYRECLHCIILSIFIMTHLKLRHPINAQIAAERGDHAFIRDRPLLLVFPVPRLMETQNVHFHISTVTPHSLELFHKKSLPITGRLEDFFF